MFREMRRGKQILSLEENESILKNSTSGVLALSGDCGYPYTVPLSYVYEDNKLYFHCAVEGHKIDAIKTCDKASFCVVFQDDILPEKYTTLYKSVIAFGKVKLICGEDMIKPLEVLTRKYVKSSEREMQAEIDRFKDKMYIIEFNIEHLTGKQCVEFIK